MSLEWAKAFAEVLQVPIADVLKHAGVADEDTARQFTPGFAEGDAAPWTPKRDDDPGKVIARALGASRPGVDIWQVRGCALALQGYLPGDMILVDSHQSELCRAGDVVIAQIYNWNAGDAKTVLRRFEPPVLVAACTEPDEMRVHVVDGNNVVIKGKVIASWRLP